MQTIKGNRKQAVISDNGNGWHVVFYINSEQVSHSKPSKVYKTYSGALRASKKWAGID